jgi:hypothetical protein
MIIELVEAFGDQGFAVSSEINNARTSYSCGLVALDSLNYPSFTCEVFLIQTPEGVEGPHLNNFHWFRASREMVGDMLC